MAEEFDVFAGSMKSPNPAPQQNGGGNNGGSAPAAAGGAPQPNPGQPNSGGHNKQQRRQFHHGKPFNRPQKSNASPIRGANGSESVNPLLNAPLPTEPKASEPSDRKSVV